MERDRRTLLRWEQRSRRKYSLLYRFIQETHDLLCKQWSMGGKYRGSVEPAALVVVVFGIPCVRLLYISEDGNHGNHISLSFTQVQTRGALAETKTLE